MVHIRKKWVSALFRRGNLRVFGGKEGKNGKSVEKKTDARGGGRGSGGRNGAHCRAESVGVLCGKYSSTLRKVLDDFAESAILRSAWPPYVFRPWSMFYRCAFSNKCFFGMRTGFSFSSVPFVSPFLPSLVRPPARSLAFSIRGRLIIRIFNP